MDFTTTTGDSPCGGGRPDHKRHLRPMPAVLLAFLSSVSWGTADFIGGLKSRALPLLNVLIASQGVGLILIVAFVALRTGAELAPEQLVRWAR